MPRIYEKVIGDPEFINVTAINPFISKADIKVLYLGANDNKTNVTRESAIKMSNTLRGCPIVGWYDDSVDDFRDHGDRQILDANGYREECLTTPYGFIDINARIWFQKFEEPDRNTGEIIERTYLMTEGYLWTKIIPHAEKALDDDTSMSLEWLPESMQGNWTTDYKTGRRLFILNDAIFTKLCILGEDIDPCFEGANIETPFISNMFSLDSGKQFVEKLASMYAMVEQCITNSNEGGNNIMPTEDILKEEPAAEMAKKQDEEQKEDTKGTDAPGKDEEDDDTKKKNQNSLDETPENQNKKTDNKSDEKKEEGAGNDDTTDDNDDAEEDDDKKKSKNSLSVEELSAKFQELSENFEKLNNMYSALVDENKSLAEFKEGVETKAKMAKINEFYMLSDADKKDVMENLSKYSVNTIEEKLAAICYRNKINFNSVEETKEEPKTEEAPATSYNLNDHHVDGTELPAWLQAVANNKKNN